MPSKLDSLCQQMENLKQQKSQQQSEDPDFELVDCSQEPLFQVMAFLEVRKLGPAGMGLLHGLTGHRPLTEAQEALLQKVLAKMGHPGWLEPILQELASTLQALQSCDQECSQKPAGWKLPGLM